MDVLEAFRVRYLISLLVVSIGLAAIWLFQFNFIIAAPNSAPLQMTVEWKISERDGMSLFPARYYFTELCDESGDTCFAGSYQQLDQDGKASFGVSNYVTGSSVTVRLYSQAQINGNGNLYVWDATGSAVVFEFDATSFVPISGSTYDLNIEFPNSLIPAYWIMDDIVESFIKIPVADQPTVLLRAFWSVQPIQASFATMPPDFAKKSSCIFLPTTSETSPNQSA